MSDTQGLRLEGGLSLRGDCVLVMPGARNLRSGSPTLLEDAGLAEFGDRNPDTLSGRQAVRVALHRVLVTPNGANARATSDQVHKVGAA